MPQELEDPEDLTVSDTDVGRYKVLDVAVAVTGADVGATAAATLASHNPSTTAAAAPPGGTDSYSSEAAVASLQDQLLRLPKEMRNIIAGGVAGMCAKSVVAPLDRIKILYQVSAAEFRIRHIPTVVRNIIANEGWAALWKGNTATLLRVFPYAGVQFMVFDWIKMWQLRKHEMVISEEAHAGDAANPHNSRKFGLTAMESLEAGMVAGTVSVVCTYPLDLTRAQLAVLRRHKHPHGHGQPQLATAKTKGFVRVILDNYHRAGVPGLFRGMPVTLFGILPYSGIAFALNEQGKREVRTTRSVFFRQLTVRFL
jgi:Mitochondrial carrier protein